MRRFIFIALGLGLIALVGAAIIAPATITLLEQALPAPLRSIVTQTTTSQLKPGISLVNRIAILSDTHEDQVYFPQIIDQIIAQANLSFVAHLGDLSNDGNATKLAQAKDLLDTIKVPVYVLPGDHDLNWFPEHDLTNFKKVFHQTKTYFSLTKNGQHFMFIDNSDLNHGIDPTQWEWIKQDLSDHSRQPIYVFMSTPISNPYLSFKAMGSQSESVAQQVKQLATVLQQAKVKVIFAGDTHIFAQYTDSTTHLPIVAVGAAGATKNLLPLYLIVEIFSDGSYNVASIPFQHAIPLQGSD